MLEQEGAGFCGFNFAAGGVLRLFEVGRVWRGGVPLGARRAMVQRTTLLAAYLARAAVHAIFLGELLEELNLF